MYFSFFFFLMIRRPPRSTLSSSSAASDVYKRQFIYYGTSRPVDSTDYRTRSSVGGFIFHGSKFSRLNQVEGAHGCGGLCAGAWSVDHENLRVFKSEFGIGTLPSSRGTISGLVSWPSPLRHGWARAKRARVGAGCLFSAGEGSLRKSPAGLMG
eukprot:TRINITY_DN37946_c0_g1_i2.p1 TRINITY_DN37946_c0_g1~~TRINITY_DN37946_c0_g1_i2.p1  ORF type:complete len:154 (+),score=17.02 TRINITY_DN37946_c0_g1_i2:104-565(+)